MLKSLPIIPSSTSQRIYPLFLFILLSLPIIPILFFCINVSGMYWHVEKQELEIHSYIVHILMIQGLQNKSPIFLKIMPLHKAQA